MLEVIVESNRINEYHEMNLFIDPATAYERGAISPIQHLIEAVVTCNRGYGRLSVDDVAAYSESVDHHFYKEK